ncbi:olfactory receptor 4P4-like [Microtus oregoni]|uniref:olfactory receptor 4P4-like n=1 Tax=Microtus oregoni TaxID=111838 RepID=UPI001BB21DB5|nr:olfactory receptor 4P4-like [Microtus oregoni]
MECTNNITEFILLGLSQNKKIKILCFLLFLFCYTAIWGGNMFVMISIIFSKLNEQPMYFFLNYLALSDLCYTSTVTPKLLTGLLKERNMISYTSCMAQLFTMHFFGGIEILILTVMAYDRYVAICKPLHYTIIMSRWRCCAMVAACCIGAFIHSFFQSFLVISLPLCGPNEMDHYFCDVYPLLSLACSNTYKVGLLVVANSGMMGLMTFIVLIWSYSFILYTIRIYPAENRGKALSTCSSHVTVVTLFFVPVLFIYIRPSVSYPEDKIFALFYTIIAPMFNPLIYTLRNMEMKNVLRQVWCHKLLFLDK